MVFGIGDHKPPLVLRHFDDIVIIASGEPACFIVHGQMETFNYRQVFWQKPALDLGDDFQLMLELISLVLNFPPQPVNGQVGIYPSLHLFGLKRF